MRTAWTVLLVGFAGLNAYAFAAAGLSELADYLGRLGPWGTLATVDLLLALSIGITWMWRDARSRDVSPVPYVVLALATGSLGLLLYLVVHGGRPAPRAGGRERAVAGPEAA